MSDARKYSDAQVRAILDRALAQSATSDGLSHDELLSIGEQVGVSRDALSRAAHELHEEQLQQEAQSSLTARRRRWLGYHAALFALVNALAFAVNFFTTPGEWWSLFSIVPWLLVVVLHAGLNAAIPISDAAVTRQRERLAARKRVTTPRLRVPAQEARPVGALEERAEGEPASEKPVVRDGRLGPGLSK